MENTTKNKTTSKHNILKKCFVCKHQYGAKNLDKHVHSYIHQKAIEQLNGSEQVRHKCWACDVSVIGLEQYQEHIATDKHKQNLLKLKRRQKQNLIVDLDSHTKLNVDPYNPQKPLKKCFVCSHSFQEQDLDKHMHSFVHHEAIEKLKGSKQVHKCQACNWSVTDLQEYKKHVRTAHHKYNMSILTENDKRTMDYSVEIDDELKTLCAQRDQQKKNKKDLLKWIETKTAAAKRKAKQKKNMSRSVQVPKPAKAGEDFTSDELPVKYKLFSSWEEQQKTSTSRPDPTVTKRRQESVFGMDSLNCPLVKRPCPPSEISAHVSREPTCAPEQVQRDMSTLLQINSKSLDFQGVNVSLEKNVENQTEHAARQTCKSNRNKELKERQRLSKKHKEQKQSKESVRNHSLLKSKGKPYSRDAFPTLRYSQQDQIDTQMQQEQCTSREQIHGQEASVASVSSVTSLAEKIGRSHSQTVATCTVNVCQILNAVENDLFMTDTDRKKINGCNAETSQEDLDSLQIISSNLKKDQDISKTTHRNPEPTCRQNKVNTLMTMCSKEEELTSSLRNVGDQLFQAYATLQTAYTEVQHLLTVKEQVTSEMSSLRAKRIQLLQDMIE